MTRPLTPGDSTAPEAETVRPIYLTELDFKSGFIRLTTAPFDVTFQSNTYLGVGDLGTISAVEETTENKAGKITLTITGIKPSFVATALNETYQGRTGKLWKAWLDDADVITLGPVLVFQGLMDVMPIALGETATISMVIVNRFVRWEHPHRNSRWDDQDHQERHPGDKFFEFVQEIAALEDITWGRR